MAQDDTSTNIPYSTALQESSSTKNPSESSSTSFLTPTTSSSSSSSSSSCPSIQETSDSCSISLPDWVHTLDEWQNGGEGLVVKEWQGEENDDGSQESVDSYRLTNGWKGRDLIHSHQSAVRILQYKVHYPPQPPTQSGGVGTTLRGLVHFTLHSESHKGYCHGGSMTSVMDDVIGWNGFCATGSCLPWSGFTVQVNCQLCKPISVGSVLLVECTIVKMERRKVFMEAVLWDPSCGGARQKDKDNVHAKAEGIVILNKGVLPAF